jgi:dihydrofolate reductase
VGRLVVINHLTLDGVMQSPGRPDEDTRGGFEMGGWAGPNIDEVVNAAVASRTLREPLRWPNSTLLGADVAGAVAQLKEEPGGDLNVMGSGELIQTLMRDDLMDEYLLLIHPLVLGTGRRLFEHGGPPASLRLVDSTASTTGVLIATYQPT